MEKQPKHKPKHTLGVDIGSQYVKMVYVKNTDKGPVLENYLSKEIFEGRAYQPQDVTAEMLASVLLQMLSEMKLKPKKLKHVVASIAGESVSVKQIKSMYLPDEELESSLYFEAKKHLAISGEGLLLDYQVRHVDDRSNQMEVLMAVTTRKALARHMKAFEMAGLNLTIVDAGEIALANSYSLLNWPEYEKGGVYIVLDIGAESSKMITFGHDALFFTRNLKIAGINVTQSIAKQKDISFEEAEKIKLEQGHKIGEGGEQNLSEVSLQDLSIGFKEKGIEEQLAEEMTRSLRYYVKESGNSDFRKVLLTGGSAKIDGIDKHLEEKLNIPVTVYNPLTLLHEQAGFEPQFAQSVGLALRDW